mgnify:CR=1 FL=1
MVTVSGSMENIVRTVKMPPAKRRLAIGITQRCSGCIGFHVKALHTLGCSRAELEEMLAICVYMGGGPALMYAGETLKAWDDLAPGKA